MIGPICISGHHMLHNDITPQYTKAAVIRKYIKNRRYALTRSGGDSGFIRTTRVQLPSRIRLPIRINIAMISSTENKNMLLFIIASQSLCNIHGDDSSFNCEIHYTDVIQYLRLLNKIESSGEMMHDKLCICH